MGFRVVILSPHGFFGQQNVLGKPDTGGQVREIVLLHPFKGSMNASIFVFVHGSQDTSVWQHPSIPHPPTRPQLSHPRTASKCAVGLCQVVYILDQVRALEREMLTRIRRQGLRDIEPQILVVTRLIPEAQGTSCDQRIEHISGTQNARILRVPFRDEHGILQQWVSRQAAPPCMPLCLSMPMSFMSRVQPCQHTVGLQVPVAALPLSSISKCRSIACSPK